MVSKGGRKRCPLCGRFLSSKASIETFEMVDECVIPKRQTGKANKFSSAIDELFESIPKGKALVIPKKVWNHANVWMALKHRQKKGMFTNLKICRRVTRNGENTYVVNPKT